MQRYTSLAQRGATSTSTNPIHKVMSVPNAVIFTLGSVLAGYYLWEKVLPYKHREIHEAFAKLNETEDSTKQEGIDYLYDLVKKDKYARQHANEDKFNEAADILWELNGWTKLRNQLTPEKIEGAQEEFLERVIYCMKTILVSDKVGKGEKRRYILHKYGLHREFQLAIREDIPTSIRIAALDLLKSLTKFNRLGRQLAEDTPNDSIGWKLVIYGEDEEDIQKFADLFGSVTDTDMLTGLVGVLAHITEKPDGGALLGKMGVAPKLLEDRFINAMRAKVKKNSIMALANMAKEQFSEFADEIINKNTLQTLMRLVPVLTPQRLNNTSNAISESVNEIFWEIMLYLVDEDLEDERDLVCEVLQQERDHTLAMFALAHSYRMSTASISKKMITLLKDPNFSKYAETMAGMAQASTKLITTLQNHMRQQQQRMQMQQMMMGMQQ